jgi:hypothetical protein
VAARNVPVDLVVHVRATSPSKQSVNARMPQMEWTFFVEDQEIVHGKLAESFLMEPGKPLDIPIPVHFDAYDAFGGRARSLYELALAIAASRATRRRSGSTFGRPSRPGSGRSSMPRRSSAENRGRLIRVRRTFGNEWARVRLALRG